MNSTAVSAPGTRRSACPGAFLALSLTAAPAMAGLAPVPAVTHWGDANVINERVEDARIVPIPLNSSSAAKSKSFDEDAQAALDQAQAAGFQIFRAGSEVAGQIWPASDVITAASQKSTTKAPLQLPAENTGTVIPAPPALQSGLCAMSALGLIALGRRARRAMR